MKKRLYILAILFLSIILPQKILSQEIIELYPSEKTSFSNPADLGMFKQDCYIPCIIADNREMPDDGSEDIYQYDLYLKFRTKGKTTMDLFMWGQSYMYDFMIYDEDQNIVYQEFIDGYCYGYYGYLPAGTYIIRLAIDPYFSLFGALDFLITDVEPDDPDEIEPSTPSIPSTASFSSDQNYIHSRTFTSEDGKNYLDQVQYFDGLGRPVQTVQRAITPSTKDLVSIQEYDAFGREAESWLPGLSTGNGAYANIEAIKQSAKSAEMNNDTNPFSKPVYENSPLNRVLEQYGPGADWHNNSKRVQTAYKTNVAGNGLLNCVLYKAGLLH
ncbi:MAG: DUF6443 domain-containing protein [Dysgonomonas sp.]|nr:DUF6443 domain-containing protein [Dysgonomonas sp.]